MVRMCDESETLPLTLLPIATEFVVSRLAYKDYFPMCYWVPLAAIRTNVSPRLIVIALPAYALDRIPGT